MDFGVLPGLPDLIVDLARVGQEIKSGHHVATRLSGKLSRIRTAEENISASIAPLDEIEIRQAVVIE